MMMKASISLVVAALLVGCAGPMAQPAGPGSVKITPLGEP
jgi:hypothetical protein